MSKKSQVFSWCQPQRFEKIYIAWYKHVYILTLWTYKYLNVEGYESLALVWCYKTILESSRKLYICHCFKGPVFMTSLLWIPTVAIYSIINGLSMGKKCLHLQKEAVNCALAYDLRSPSGRITFVGNLIIHVLATSPFSWQRIFSLPVIYSLASK